MLKSRKSQKEGNRKKQGIRKCRKSEKIGNQKMQDIGESR